MQFQQDNLDTYSDIVDESDIEARIKIISDIEKNLINIKKKNKNISKTSKFYKIMLCIFYFYLFFLYIQFLMFIAYNFMRIIIQS